VLSLTGPSAWGISPDGSFFAVAMPPTSTNSGAPVMVYPVRRGPQKWPAVINTAAWPDGRWGFSADATQFIVTRLQNSPIQFSIEAFNLKASSPGSAVLRLSETNVSGPTVTTSPCGDRLMYFRWTQPSPLQGQADFFARSSYPSTNRVITNWDGVAPTTPTASAAAGTVANDFQVLLQGLTTPSGQRAIPSLQCNP